MGEVQLVSWAGRNIWEIARLSILKWPLISWQCCFARKLKSSKRFSSRHFINSRNETCAFSESKAKKSFSGNLPDWSGEPEWSGGHGGCNTCPPLNDPNTTLQGLAECVVEATCNALHILCALYYIETATVLFWPRTTIKNEGWVKQLRKPSTNLQNRLWIQQTTTIQAEWLLFNQLTCQI